MALVLESGIGVRGANAYVDATYVTAYLTERNRVTENSWSTATSAAKDAAIIAATDYIEKRWGPQFLGARLVSFQDEKAEGAIAFTGVPSNDETLTLGDRVYTFKSTLTPDSYEVLIGGSAAATAQNLYDALVATAGTAGVAYGEDTEATRHASVTIDGATLTLVATAPGAQGDETILSGSPTNVTLTAFSGGLDGGSQPLSFPRSGLYDRSGNPVYGVPLKVRQATAEYAVRALAAALVADPTFEAAGGSVVNKREKVGPIEEETRYLEGSHLSVVFAPYPAADRLLEEYVMGGTGVYTSGRAVR